MAVIRQLRPAVTAMSRGAARARPTTSSLPSSSSLQQRQAPLRSFATEPTKKPTPPAAINGDAEQSMPRGLFYDSFVSYKMPSPNHFPRDKPAATTPEEKTPEPKPKNNPDDPEPEIKPKVEPKDEKPTPTSEKKPPPRDKDVAKNKENADGDDKAEKKPTKARSRKKSAATTTTTTKEGRGNPSEKAASARAEAEERARVVFGSSLAGPASRLRASENRKAATVVAGVEVPARPEEPDHCCMSGCVNCVWDQYREDMEAWSLANSEAQRRLVAAREGAGSSAAAAADTSSPRAGNTTTPPATTTTTSVEEDGGAVSWEPPKIAKNLWDDELYKNLPVGIREFMKQEKRLKERRGES